MKYMAISASLLRNVELSGVEKTRGRRLMSRGSLASWAVPALVCGTHLRRLTSI
jgi:hypothetical protein